MRRSIIVPLDGTPSAEGALPSAAALADALDARLLLVQPVPARPPAPGATTASRICRVAHAHESLQSCAAVVHARNPFLRVGLCAPIGPWPDALLDEAALERTELIVADRRLGAAPLGDASGQMGSRAVALSRRSDLPLLLLTPAAGGLIGALEADAPLRVLVPLDGSPTAEAILPVLVRLGASVPLRAMVLHVLPEPGEALATRRHVTWATSAAYCRRAAEWLSRHGVPAAVEIRSGDAVEEIGRAALDLGLDHVGLLALGLPEALPWRFGYSAERIIRSAPVPVLQLRSARCEHVVPLGDEPAPAARDADHTDHADHIDRSVPTGAERLMVEAQLSR